METNENIALNRWITSTNQNFSYQFYWPFSNDFDPDKAIIEVYVRLNSNSKRYVGTFLTMKELVGWFDRFNQNGEYANGIYIPFGEKNKELLLKKISYRAVEKTLEDLLKKNEFLKYFEEVIE